MALVEHLGPYAGGELPEAWAHTFTDADGNPIPIEGFTVRLTYRVNRGPRVERVAEAGLLPGQAIYRWTAEDFAVAGLMEGEMVAGNNGTYRPVRSFRLPITVPLGGTVPAI